MLSSYVPDEVAERAREERHRQTMMQVNQWAQLCKGNGPSISSDDRSEQVVIPASVETEMAIEHPSKIPTQHMGIWGNEGESDTKGGL